MNIAIVLYDRFTALDAIGPYEVLSRLPGASVVFAAVEAGPVRTDNDMLTLLAERSLEQVRQPDIGHSDARVAEGSRPDEHMDDVRVHRLADPRRRRPARR
jgi:putative intracellular protease/amidase